MDDFDSMGPGPAVGAHASRQIEPGGACRHDGKALMDAMRPGFDVLPDPVFVFSLLPGNSPGRFLYANDAAADMLGRPRDTFVSFAPQDLMPERQHEALGQAMARMADQETTLEQGVLLDAADGEVPVEAGLRLVACADGRLVVCICRTLRQRVAVREALDRAMSNYRRLFDDAVQGGFQTTLGGRFVRVNQAMVDMLGYDSPEDLILSIRDIAEQLYVDAGDRERYVGVLEAQGKARRYETRFKRKDGTPLWVALNVRLLRGGDGGESYIEGFCTDITDVKRAEAMLRDSEELHRVLLMSLTDTVCITDDAGRFTYVSPNSEAMFGMTPDEIMALPGMGALLGEGLACAEVLGGRDEVPNIEATVNVGGEEKSLLVTVKAVDIAGGTCLFACRDVTDRRVLEAEARRAMHLAALGELAAGVAHEINSPLNGIMLYAETLQDDAVDLGEAADAPERILRQGERVSAIVRKLLTFSREPDEAVYPVGVRGILDDALALARVGLVRDGVILGVDVPDGLPPVVGREQEVQQVFMNLISNARDALGEKHEKGSKDKRLDIAADVVERDGRRFVRVAFHDRGAGIPDDVRERILAPFFSTKSKSGGTGLGLTITLRILTALGGELAIDSREGGPTCVAAEFAVWEEA